MIRRIALASVALFPVAVLAQSAPPQPLRPIADDPASTQPAAQKLHPEGSTIVNRAGRVIERDGEFLFQPLMPADDEPDLHIMPSLHLMAIERLLEQSPDAVVRLTGTITQYRGRNHLLVDRAERIIAPPDEPSPTIQPAEAAEPQPGSDNAEPREPEEDARS